MSHWWRAYDGSIDHPKLLKLSDRMHRAWYTLQCVASANGGVLPPTGDIAARLREKPAKVAEWLTHLVRSGLIDNDGGIFKPHNWDTRQYKSDVTDPTAPQRMQRYRDRKRNERNVTVTAIRPDTEQIQNDDGMTRAGASMISPEAFEITGELERACGFNLPEEIPPGWYGCAMWTQKCLNEGWIGAVMVDAAKSVALRKKGGFIEGFKYLEKPLAQAMAEHRAPLPQVEVRQPEKLTVIANEKSAGNIIQAADRLLDKIRSFDAGPDEDNRIRDAAGEASTRLLSKG